MGPKGSDEGALRRLTRGPASNVPPPLIRPAPLGCLLPQGEKKKARAFTSRSRNSSDFPPPRPARPHLLVPPPACRILPLVPSQGRARSAGEPKRRRERRERGPCRTVGLPSRAPGKGNPSGRRRRFGRAVQDVLRAAERGERLQRPSAASRRAQARQAADIRTRSRRGLETGRSTRPPERFRPGSRGLLGPSQDRVVARPARHGRRG